MTVLALDGFGCGYGQARVIRDVGLEIRAGEALAGAQPGLHRRARAGVRDDAGLRQAPVQRGRRVDVDGQRLGRGG